MSDLIRKQWIFHSALIIFMYWVFVFSMPFMISDREVRSETPLWYWCALAVAVAYFSYTGFRAWRRGWKARFILRIVVPAMLLLSVSTLAGLLAWLDWPG